MGRGGGDAAAFRRRCGNSKNSQTTPATTSTTPIHYGAPLTRKRHIPPHPAQPRHTNYWAPRMRKQHQQEHRPQRPTESSDPTQHAKGGTGDCPWPRKETTTRRNVTQGGGGGGLDPPDPSCTLPCVLSIGASAHGEWVPPHPVARTVKLKGTGSNDAEALVGAEIAVVSVALDARFRYMPQYTPEAMLQMRDPRGPKVAVLQNHVYEVTAQDIEAGGADTVTLRVRLGDVRVLTASTEAVYLAVHYFGRFCLLSGSTAPPSATAMHPRVLDPAFYPQTSVARLLYKVLFAAPPPPPPCPGLKQFVRGFFSMAP